MKTSRYGDTRKVTDNGHGWYTIEGKAHYYRVGSEPDSSEVSYFDPEGGPMIQVGDSFQGRKIATIMVESAPKDHFKIRIETV